MLGHWIGSYLENISQYVHLRYADLGFIDTVLQWFSSYPTDRTNNVYLSNHCSNFNLVHAGVPMGSFLGPIPFTMYIMP